MYGLIWLTDLRSKIDSIDLLIMLTSAICHDLDHTGYNNAYQVHEIPSFPLNHNTKWEFWTDDGYTIVAY